MVYSLIAHTEGATAVGGGTFTTSPAINTAAADLIVVAVSQYQAAGALAALSDSVGNTYSPLTAYFGTGFDWCRLYYVQGASVGSATHTFTLTGTTFYGVVNVLAFAGSIATPADGDVGVGTATNATSIQPGALVPAGDDELIVTAIGCSSAGSGFAIDGGFTIADAGQAFTSGQCMGGALAYLIQTVGGSVNPTWSWTGSGIPSVAMTAFKPLSGTPKVAWPQPMVMF